MLGTARQSPSALSPLSPNALRGLYAWLDRLPLSRPKRHLARDFSDGVMLAEIVKHFHPRLVDLHNYIPTCNTDQKLSNWSILNRKVFHKLRFCVSETDIRKVVANTPGAIEPILCVLRDKVESGAAFANPPSTADPGLSRVDAVGPWAELTTPPHTGVNTLQNHGALERMGCSACGGGDPGVQQLLEDKEQALAILQEILQMKVVRLEHLVKLKDQKIGELMRRCGQEQRRGPPGGATLPKAAKP
ncbi:sperm flagellar protein 1-like isoform X2 [Tupaia chinensis]|uniref:sperm flagellar protein 1-like isoform X2 n=1 Tax=Tupaia chinensis TaxID=246437 RepID=UPI000703FF60|nr:sperm flagellar protein 1-like isoform X2 [Tupaia chinensis]